MVVTWGTTQHQAVLALQDTEPCHSRALIQGVRGKPSSALCSCRAGRSQLGLQCPSVLRAGSFSLWVLTGFDRCGPGPSPSSRSTLLSSHMQHPQVLRSTNGGHCCWPWLLYLLGTKMTPVTVCALGVGLQPVHFESECKVCSSKQVCRGQAWPPRPGNHHQWLTQWVCPHGLVQKENWSLPGDLGPGGKLLC
jgi:hypothetical protein